MQIVVRSKTSFSFSESYEYHFYHFFNKNIAMGLEPERLLLCLEILMLPHIIYTKKRIFRYYTGFSFFLFIWISTLEKDQERLIRHERIHYRQQTELLFVFHWLLYGLFYLISRIKGQRHYIAYRYNPFEIEAYQHDTDASYLNRRRHYAWTKSFGVFIKNLNRKPDNRIPVRKEIRF